MQYFYQYRRIFTVWLLILLLNRRIRILLSPLNTDFKQKQCSVCCMISQGFGACRQCVYVCTSGSVCVSSRCAVMAPRDSETSGGTVQIAASFQAFMPSHLPPRRDHLWLIVLLDLLLNYPSIILPSRAQPSTPQACRSPAPATLRLPFLAALFWGPEIRLRLRLLDSPSLHCDTLFPSVACCPPANRDWWGGTDRCETRPSSGAHRTRPRSLTSLSQLHSPQQTEKAGARDARVKGKRDKTAAESTSQ